ncbi:Basic leucine zipper 23 [Linum perenne]
MEDGEVEFSNQEVFSATNMGEFPSSGSMDSFFDELLKDTHACTHTHTCNPPGPDYSHTHTCFHVHTKIVEKKKARAASLEDEVVKLRAINQQLMRRLQGQAALEAEVARLKCLLVDIRGRIEGEIGSFPYQKPNLNLSNPNGAYVMNPCNMQCNDQAYCGCDFENLQCMMNDSSGTKDFSVCGVGNGVANGMTTGSSKRKGEIGC